MGGSVGRHDHDIRQAIDAFWLENCYPPSVRDIMRHTEASSTSVVFASLRRLEAQGVITRAEGLAWAIVPVWVREAIGNGHQGAGDV